MLKVWRYGTCFLKYLMKELSLPSNKCFLPYGASWKLRLIVHCILNTCIYCITCITPGVSADTYLYYSRSVRDQQWKHKQKHILRNVRTVCHHTSAADILALLQPPVSLPPPHSFSLITIFSSSKGSYVSPSSPFPPHRIFSGLSCVNTQSRCLSPGVIIGSLAALTVGPISP